MGNVQAGNTYLQNHFPSVTYSPYSCDLRELSQVTLFHGETVPELIVYADATSDVTDCTKPSVSTVGLGDDIYTKSDCRYQETS
jgi:hypothetical protein